MHSQQDSPLKYAALHFYETDEMTHTPFVTKSLTQVSLINPPVLNIHVLFFPLFFFFA